MRRFYIIPAAALALIAVAGTASAQPSGTSRGRGTSTAPRQFSSRPASGIAFRSALPGTARGGRAAVTPRKRRVVVVVPAVRRPHPRPVVIVRPVRPLPVGGFGGAPCPPGGNLTPGTVPPPGDPGTNPGPDPNADPNTDPNTDPGTGNTDPNSTDPTDPDPPEDPDSGGTEPNQ